MSNSPTQNNQQQDMLTDTDDTKPAVQESLLVEIMPEDDGEVLNG